jgi:protein-tyrosine phosphatase
MEGIGYIDIHSHILPEVDDGASSIEETRQMLKLASKQGIRTIIATPHYSCGEKNQSVAQLQRAVEMVQDEAVQIDKDFKILLGNELYYNDAIISDLKSGKALTLAKSRYILVEFSEKEEYKLLYKKLRQLILAGYAPILAHMERYTCIRKKEALVRELIELGVYTQMNSSSLLGGVFGSETFYNRKLFRKGFIHFIGSDCHDVRLRPPLLEDTARKLYSKTEKQLVDMVLFDNPSRILNNKFI